MINEIFKIIRSDGFIREIKGYIEPMEGYLSDAPGYSSDRYSEDELPVRVDLRPHMTSVEDQARANSCTANAVAGAYEYLAKRINGETEDVSRLFIYYNARKMAGEPIQDKGSYISLGLKSLTEYGACSEETWPYDLENVNEEPSEEAYEEGSEFLVESIERIPTDLHAWKHCLAEGNPVVFGIKTYSTFDSHKKKGLVPAPSSKEESRASHGAHAMLCVGYSEKDKLFIVRNSWGTSWGDGGYCYIPYRYIINEKHNLNDSWIIKRLENFDVDEDLWDDSEESIMEDYDSEIANMDDEEYEEMLDAMGDYPLEYRIGLIFIHGANADEEISDEELEGISDYMAATLEALGSELSAKDILKFCLKNAENEELLEESIELLGEYLSQKLLASITSSLEEIIGSDDLAEEEEEFVDRLIDAWQISNDDDYDDEEDDDDEEEDDDDDDYDDDDERKK